MPSASATPQIVCFNSKLAKELGMQSEPDSGLLNILSGNQVPEGSNPIALAYAGHQFGQFVPALGDGRAILLGEIISIKNERKDLQLKGSGKTEFSRRGDGRAALGPVLREYIVSEAMHALGVPTTRSLAAIRTKVKVIREKILDGAVLSRVAASHIRIGTFEYFAHKEDLHSLKILADYAINRHYPEIKDQPNPYLAFLDAVINVQSYLVSKWMHVGFIHGVMNTDNMSISGETIDYGPCAFMDRYDPETVFSYIDQNGRYAYGNQALIAEWNLTRFAECLLPLIDRDKNNAITLATECLNNFKLKFEKYWLSGMRAKLGLSSELETDLELILNLLDLMNENKLDYTNTFLCLKKTLSGQLPQTELAEWTKLWQKRLESEKKSLAQLSAELSSLNPAYIPRNHKIQQALDAAEIGDYSKVHKLLEVLEQPFFERAGYEDFQKSPAASEEVEYTFCGT